MTFGEVDMANTESDHLVAPQPIGCLTFASTLSFDGVSPDDDSLIATFPSFSIPAVKADVEIDFEHL